MCAIKVCFSSYLFFGDADGVELCDDLSCELKFGYAEVLAQVSASGGSGDEQDVG